MSVYNIMPIFNKDDGAIKDINTAEPLMPEVNNNYFDGHISLLNDMTFYCPALTSDAHGSLTQIFLISEGYGYSDTTTVSLPQPNQPDGVQATATPYFGLTVESLIITGGPVIPEEYIYINPNNINPISKSCIIKVLEVDSGNNITKWTMIRRGVGFDNSLSDTINFENDSYNEFDIPTNLSISYTPDKLCVSEIVLDNPGSGYSIYSNNTLINKFPIAFNNIGSGVNALAYGVFDELPIEIESDSRDKRSRKDQKNKFNKYNSKDPIAPRSHNKTDKSLVACTFINTPNNIQSIGSRYAWDTISQSWSAMSGTGISSESNQCQVNEDGIVTKVVLGGAFFSTLGKAYRGQGLYTDYKNNKIIKELVLNDNNLQLFKKTRQELLKSLKILARNYVALMPYIDGSGFKNAAPWWKIPYDKWPTFNDPGKQMILDEIKKWQKEMIKILKEMLRKTMTDNYDQIFKKELKILLDWHNNFGVCNSAKSKPTLLQLEIKYKAWYKHTLVPELLDNIIDVLEDVYASDKPLTDQDDRRIFLARLLKSLSRLFRDGSWDPVRVKPLSFGVILDPDPITSLPDKECCPNPGSSDIDKKIVIDTTKKLPTKPSMCKTLRQKIKNIVRGVSTTTKKVTKNGAVSLAIGIPFFFADIAFADEWNRESLYEAIISGWGLRDEDGPVVENVDPEDIRQALAMLQSHLDYILRTPGITEEEINKLISNVLFHHFHELTDEQREQLLDTFKDVLNENVWKDLNDNGKLVLKVIISLQKQESTIEEYLNQQQLKLYNEAIIETEAKDCGCDVNLDDFKYIQDPSVQWRLNLPGFLHMPKESLENNQNFKCLDFEDPGTNDLFVN